MSVTDRANIVLPFNVNIELRDVNTDADPDNGTNDKPMNDDTDVSADSDDEDYGVPLLYGDDGEVYPAPFPDDLDHSTRSEMVRRNRERVYRYAVYPVWRLLLKSWFKKHMKKILRQKRYCIRKRRQARETLTAICDDAAE
jgi:hypothetical protein